MTFSLKSRENPGYLLSYPKLNRFPNCSFENEMFHEKHQAFIVNMIIRCLLIEKHCFRLMYKNKIHFICSNDFKLILK